MRRLAVILLAVIPCEALAQTQADVDIPALRIVRDPCARSDTDDIVVCGNRDKNAPHRLPKVKDGFDPKGPVDSVGRERVRLMQGDESGIGSCSNRGPGGMTGCWLQGVKDSRLQRGK